MKKLLFVIIGLVVQLGFSQSKLFVHSKKPEINHSPDANCQIGDYEYQFNISYETGIYETQASDIDIIVDYKEGFNDDPNWNCNGPFGQFSWYCDDPDDKVQQTLGLFEAINISYGGPNEITCTSQYDAQTCLPIDYFAVLLPNLNIGDSDRCPTQLLFEQYQDNQDHSVEGLKWQYYNINNEWVDIPNFSNRYPLNVSLEEALGPNYDSLFNGILQLRYTVESSFTNVVLNPEDIFTFNIISCSPQLLDLTPHKTSCVGAEDGSFTMTMDRDLEDGEELVVSVYNVNNEDVLLVQGDTTILVDNGDDTYSYTFPKGLVQGEYKVKYQTHPDEENNQNLQWNSLEFSDSFEIQDPLPVTFSLQKLNDVYCFEGSDGSLKITASGGSEDGKYQFMVNNEGAWIDFNNPNLHIVNNLSEGDYEVAVRRVNGNTICLSQENHEEHIDQPSESVSVELFQYVEPTGYEFTDGSITVVVSGGTPYQNNSYDYTWYDEDDNPINTTSAQYVNNVYNITLENVTAGTYTLAVTDANYNQATDKGGCMLTEDFELPGPPKLQLNVEESIPISCNSANAYNNPSNDGQLTAIAYGGVPPYDYSWNKKDENNQWQDIPNNNSNVLGNLEAGQYAVNIEDANGIIMGTYVNNQLQQATPIIYVLKEPELLTVQIEKTDIYCFGGTDGTAIAIVNGGTPPFEYLWSTGSTMQTAEGLWLGNHTVYVVDSRGCEAEAEITIGQPDAPVSISNPQYVQPTAFGFTNGSISVQVNGGTPFNNDSYIYQWRDEQDNVINTTTAQTTLEGYVIQVHDIPAGTYTLTVTDANYGNATQKEGCTYIAELVLGEPPALELSVEQTMPISCNGENQFNNPSDDGQLMAIASGGVPFNPLIEGQFAYSYTWKKKDDQNIWQIIPNVTGNVLDNVDAGEYAVNIEDANGIILGVYVNNVLEEPTDYEYPVQETEPITLQLDKLDVSCYNGNDGWATVAMQGGMPPYDISWSSGADTEFAENLMAGTYFVYVMDFYGCEVSAQVTIDQPEELIVNVIDTVSPSCYDAEDGSLSVEISGGIPPYTYLWNTGEVSLSLDNIGQGSYNLEVTDAVGCTTGKEVTLEAPFPTQVDLGGNRTLCNGQEHTLDITINDPNAMYLWTSDNGFSSTSPKVALSKSGVYTATLTNSLGCSGHDTIKITTTETEIDSQFLITSQAFAGEDIVLVNTSNPIGTNEEWVFPMGMEIIEQEKGVVIVRFEEPGAYEVILRNYQEDCYKDIVKTIIVAEARELPDVGESVTPFIKEFKVSPNPSSGTFTVLVSLQEPSTVALRLFGLTSNNVHDEQELKGSALYEVLYTMDLSSGVYLLLLETSKGREIRKLVIL